MEIPPRRVNYLILVLIDKRERNMYANDMRA